MQKFQHRKLVALFIAASTTLLAAGCSGGASTGQGGGGVSLPPAGAAASRGGVVVMRPGTGVSPIQHIIVVMQENRSFDNLFENFPGANTVTSGMGHGKVYTLQPVPLTWNFPMPHDHPQFLEDYDGGKGDGFDDLLRGYKTGSACGDPINHPACWKFWPSPAKKQMAFSYVVQSDIQPYWTMASEYALGDNTFSSNNGPSFPSHEYMVAAQSGHASEIPDGQPWGCDEPPSTNVEVLQYGQATPPVFPAAVGHEVPGPFPCFTYPSIANLLDASKVSWHYYVSTLKDAGLDAFGAIQAVRFGKDWRKIEAPDTKILTDITNGKLAAVSWVTPAGGKSDHSGPGSGNGGPDWVASIVNAVGESPYWNSTAIVIMWDEWGGWFDHVIPPQLADPVTGAYEGLGFRVPVIVVSPYARAGYISHQQHEIASNLHFIEETFALASLGGADARTDGFDDMFDFTQPPIPFQPIPTHHNASYFIAHPSNQPGDDY
jgi:phospholipase C